MENPESPDLEPRTSVGAGQGESEAARAGTGRGPEIAKADREMSEDICAFCGAHIGYGVKWLHLGVCDDQDCQDQEEEALND